MTMGIDLGDRYSYFYRLDAAGENTESGRVQTTRSALEKRYRGGEAARVVIEAGTHSPWVSRLLGEWGHEVLVANPRKLALITKNERKDDPVDAELLARLGRVEPQLLSPIAHRGAEAQADLAVIRARGGGGAHAAGEPCAGSGEELGREDAELLAPELGPER